MLLRLARQPCIALPGRPEVALAPLDAALLAWLALEGPTPRTRLAALLWPDKDAEAARNSLRQRVFQLRRQLGVDAVEGSATLALAAGVRHDLADAASVLGDAAAPAAGEFAAWLAQQRECRRDRTRSAVAERAARAEEARDWDAALGHARELLALDPLGEDAHRRLMRLHYLRGDRAAALLAFDACERVLKDEVGARPSAETLALLATIEAGDGAGGLAVVARPVPASVLRPPRLVGRARELAALHAAVDAGHVSALIGEAGLGKTRLLQEFAATRPGALHVAARPGDAGVPLATLARLLRALLASTPAADASALPAPTRGEIARVLPEFGAVDAAPRAPADGHRLTLLRAVHALIASTAPPHAPLVVDDLHFADAASLDLLAGLADGDAPRWVFAWRPAEAGSPLQALHDRLVEKVRLVALPLAPLDLHALAELVDSLGLAEAGGVSGAALAPGLLQRTGGNPLFLLETLKQAWVEQALGATSDATRWPRPQSVGRLIERRVAQLSPGALALARVASVAGVDFSIELAEAVLQAGALQFADALNELEAAHVLRGTAFAHDLVFDAVRDSVPRAIAALLHARVAAWLEPRGGEPARIAEHWLAAGRDTAALPWLAQAAERAGAAVRRREQIEFLDRKSRIEHAAGDRRAAFDTLMQAAEIEVTLDDMARSAALCDRLDALADDAAQRVRAAVQRSNLAVMRGFVREAEQLAERALREALREGVAEAHVAACRLALGTALSTQERPADALVHFEAVLGWVRAHADEAMRCEFHGNLATTYDRLCRFDDGAAQHREALRCAQAVGDHGNWAVCLSNYGSNRTRMGALADADALLDQAQRVCAQAAEPSAIAGYIAIERAAVHRQAGRYASALREVDAGLPLLDRFAPGYVPVLLAHRATCWAHLGQWARLARTLDEIERADAVPARTRVRIALLRHQAAVAQRRTTDDAALEAALASMADNASPDFAHALQIERASLRRDADALAVLETVADEAAALGHAMTRLPALARAAAIALALQQTERASRHARDAWALAATVAPVIAYPLDAWADCAAVFDAVGAHDARAAVCRRAREWIDAALAREVPAEFRASFVERNPANRRLLALATRA